MTTSPARRPEDELIDFIVDHVRKGDAKKQEALEHYRRAGEGLIKLKAECDSTPGPKPKDRPRDRQSFSELIRSSRLNRIGRAQCFNLMKLANEWPVDWERWQEIQGNKKPAPKKPTPKPSADDLEHALKLAAMRDRGGTPNEREVAAEKLSRFASTFDLTADVLETKAQQSFTSNTSNHTTTDQKETDHDHHDLHDFDHVYGLWLHRVRRNAAELDRDTLLDIIARLHASLEVRGHNPTGDRPSWERV